MANEYVMNEELFSAGSVCMHFRKEGLEVHKHGRIAGHGT